MAEGRMLKRCISESKKLGRLKSDSARLLYTWLIPWLDVEGRHSADPEIIKGHIFPKVKNTTPRKISTLLDILNDEKLIILYIANGESYLQFLKFQELQTIRKDREGESKIPSPSQGSRITPGVSQDESSISKDNIIEDKLKESKLNSLCLEKFQDEDIRLTQLLIDKMTENNPNSSILRRLTPKRQEVWINECRKLREIDKRSFEQIEQIIIFSQNDSFWKSNILSMPKLREKFDQLWLKAKKEKFSGIKEWLNES